MKNQRQATCETILNVLKERGVNYELGGEIAIAQVLTDADKHKVRNELFDMFREGKIQYSPEFRSKVQDDSELKKYISGLVNNWIRKAPEFNNDTRYVAKNPGSRAGAGDERLKEMKKLLNVTTDATAKAIIQQAIDERVAEIKGSNQVTIDIDLLPESLRSKLGL